MYRCASQWPSAHKMYINPMSFQCTIFKAYFLSLNDIKSFVSNKKTNQTLELTQLAFLFMYMIISFLFLWRCTSYKDRIIVWNLFVKLHILPFCFRGLRFIFLHDIDVLALQNIKIYIWLGILSCFVASCSLIKK